MLRGVNLNLLPILRELLRERNVTAAAKRLNLTQSGVSEALGRLRVQFGDELLVKTGRRMVPTALALEIAPRLEDLLATTEDLLRPVRFNPAYSDREIRIATGDTVALALGKGLLQRLAAQAPRTTIQFVSTEAPMRANLEEGKIDFLIIPRGVIPSTILSEEGLERLPLYREDWVIIARRDHPKLTGPLTLDLLDELPSIACRLDDLSYLHGAIPGRRRVDQIQVSQFTLLPILVAESDAVAMVQRHVADWFTRLLPIQIHALPLPFPELEVCAYWSAFHRNDPMHGWVREQIRQIAVEGGHAWLPVD